MKSVYGTLAALAFAVTASVATASIETDVAVQSSCSQPKVTVPTLAAPVTTVQSFSTPTTVYETPTQTFTVPGQRVEIPGQTVEVVTQQAAVATYACPPACPFTATLQTATDVEQQKTVWKEARLRTLLANRNKDREQRRQTLTTTSTMQTTQTATVATEHRLKRHKERSILTKRNVQLDGIELK